VPYNAIMPGDQLLLRPTVIGGDAAPDDYQVIWNGMPIGRILEQPGVPLGPTELVLGRGVSRAVTAERPPGQLQ
jgi:hypothetical protein